MAPALWIALSVDGLIPSVFQTFLLLLTLLLCTDYKPDKYLKGKTEGCQPDLSIFAFLVSSYWLFKTGLGFYFGRSHEMAKMSTHFSLLAMVQCCDLVSEELTTNKQVL